MFFLIWFFSIATMLFTLFFSFRESTVNLLPLNGKHDIFFVKQIYKMICNLKILAIILLSLRKILYKKNFNFQMIFRPIIFIFVYR